MQLITDIAIPNTDFIVMPGGKYPTITSALHQATGGERIVVKTGIYRENLVLDKTVELIAAGTVIIENNEYCIWMQTDYAVMRGFTLHCLATLANEKAAIYIPQGQLIVDQCEVTSNFWSCIEISGRGTQAIVQKCILHDSRLDNGISIYDAATAYVEDCDIFGNANAGVQIINGANSTLRRCKIRDNEGFGVLVSENGAGQIEDCDIFGNALSGVAITEGGNSTLRRCTIKNNAYKAVWVYDKGQGTIEDCDLRDNKRGAWDIDSTSQVQRNRNEE